MSSPRLASILAITFITVGILCNQFFITYLMAKDGEIISTKILTIIYLFQFSCITLGFVFWYYQPKFIQLIQQNFSNIVILIGALILSFSIAELAMAFIPGYTPVPPLYVGEYRNRSSINFKVDKDTGWRMHPNHTFFSSDRDDAIKYTSNRSGFRSDKEFTTKDAIIALVGDSFTFGSGVHYNKTFGALIEKGLADHSVFNFAMPGFGIDQMWMSLKHQVGRSRCAAEKPRMHHSFWV